MTTRQEIIDSLAQTPAILTHLTELLSEEHLNYRPGVAEWSVREILAHLVDDEMYVTRLRMERILKEDLPELTPHDQEAWFQNRNTSRDELFELLEDFAIQRRASIAMLRMLRESDWQRMGRQPEYHGGQFTAEQWLAIWNEHDQIHIQQIEANLKAFAQEIIQVGS